MLHSVLKWLYYWEGPGGGEVTEHFGMEPPLDSASDPVITALCVWEEGVQEYSHHRSVTNP